MTGLQDYWLPWLISNIAALLILWASWRNTRLGRLLFVLLFGWAAWMNSTTALKNPDAYLEYANMSIPLYKRIIEGWFSDHITPIILLISLCQLCISVGFALKGNWVRWAGAGAILFFIGIAPLGVGSGFPFSVSAGIAAFLILKRKGHDYLWYGVRRVNRPGQVKSG